MVWYLAAPDQITLPNSKIERTCALKAVTRGAGSNLRPVTARDVCSERRQVPSARLALPTASSIWEPNANFESRMTPRSRISDARSKVTSLMRYDARMGFLRSENVMTLHFIGFSFNFQSSDHEQSFCKLIWRATASSGKRICLQSFKTSAYMRHVDDREDEMSLQNKTKRNGPQMLPSGTPDKILTDKVATRVTW